MTVPPSDVPSRTEGEVLKQAGAIISSVIDAAFEGIQYRQCDQCGTARQPVAREFFTQETCSICTSPSEVFSATLPTNPSQTTTSVVPL